MENRLKMKPVLQEIFAPFNSDHRLRVVGNVNGIEFIDDSRSTNINSTWYSLEVMEKPTILILGGVDKGNDFSQLDTLVIEKVMCVVLLGHENSNYNKKIWKHFEPIVPVKITHTIMDCVGLCYNLAKPGYAVLLSPACASFDLFENYRDRGQQFEQMVKRL